MLGKERGLDSSQSFYHFAPIALGNARRQLSPSARAAAIVPLSDLVCGVRPPLPGGDREAGGLERQRALGLTAPTAGTELLDCQGKLKKSYPKLVTYNTFGQTRYRNLRI